MNKTNETYFYILKHSPKVRIKQTKSGVCRLAYPTLQLSTYNY